MRCDGAVAVLGDFGSGGYGDKGGSAARQRMLLEQRRDVPATFEDLVDVHAEDGGRLILNMDRGKDQRAAGADGRFDVAAVGEIFDFRHG